MSYADATQVNTSHKVVSRVFTLVILLFAVLSVVFAILTIVSNNHLRHTDYSSYLSYSSDLSCNKVYASTEYKISNKISLTNHTREKMLVDMVFVYEEPSGIVFSVDKSVNVNIAESQDIYIYFYRDTTVKLISISYKVSFMSDYVTMYSEDLYTMLYDGQDIWTMGRVMQNILLMAICLLFLTLCIILFVITKQMFKREYYRSLVKTKRG